MLRLRVLLLLALSVSSCFATSRVSESDNWIVGTKQHNTIKRMIESGICNSAELQGRQTILIVTAGAAYEEVFVLGAVRSDARILATHLEKWAIQNADSNADVQWSQDDDYAAAHYVQSNAHFLSSGTQQTIRFGSLVARFNEASYPASACLLVPRYATVSQLVAREGAAGKYTRFYDISSAKPSDSVEMSTSVTNSQKILFFVFVFGVPFVLFTSLAYATSFAKNTKIDRKKRQALYPKVALWPTFGAIGIHAPFAFFVIFSGYLRPMVDVWFGTSSVVVLFPFLMGPPLLMMLTIPFLGKVERKLFAESDQVTKPKTTEIGVSDKKARITLTILLWIVGAICWYIARFQLDTRHSNIHSILGFMGITLAIFASQIATVIVNRRRVDSISMPTDDPLFNWVQGFAKLCDVQVKTLNIAEPDGTTQGYDFTLMNGTLSMTRRALNELSQDELDFGLVKTLIIGSQLGRRLFRVMLLPLVIMFPLLFGSMFLAHVVGINQQYGFLAPMVVMLVCMPLFSRYLAKWMKLRKIEVFVQSLRLIPNASAARSYEAKRLELTLGGRVQNSRSKLILKTIENEKQHLEEAIRQAGLS